MKPGFYTMMAGQFFSSLAHNALLVAAIALLAQLAGPAWMVPMLKFFFVVSYVLLAAWVGAFADSMPKGRVMFITNLIKVGGCAMMLFYQFLTPAGVAEFVVVLVAYAVVGFGAAAYSPAKYGILTELLPPQQLVADNGWIEGTTVGSIILMGVLWGEIEANTYTARTSGGNLKVRCPLVLSPRESGTIRTTITNTINEETKPVVISRISHGKGTQDTRQTLTLAPGQSQTLEWTVDRSNIVFDRMILVHVNQWRYSKLEPNEGACGILVLDLFGPRGLWSLTLVLTVSSLLILAGAMIWIRNHSDRDEHSNKVIQMGRVFVGWHRTA